jgi:hypothetical protein
MARHSCTYNAAPVSVVRLRPQEKSGANSRGLCDGLTRKKDRGVSEALVESPAERAEGDSDERPGDRGPTRIRAGGGEAQAHRGVAGVDSR